MLTLHARRTAILLSSAALVVSASSLASTSAGAASPHPATASKAKIVAGQLDTVSVVPHSKTAWALGRESTKTTTSVYAVKGSGNKWSKVAIKAPAQPQFAGLAAGSSKSIWLAGYYYDKHSKQHPLIERSKGGAFRQVKTKLPSGGLTAIAASSKSNAWAVGNKSDGSPLLARWNGKSWKVVPIGGEPNGLSFTSISTTSATNVWLLGGQAGVLQVAHGGAHGFHVSGIHTPLNAQLTSIATASSKNTWVAGYHQVTHGSQATNATLVEHWNGSKWKVVKSASPDASDFAESVAVQGSHVYVVGQGSSKSGAKVNALMLHLKGGQLRTQAIQRRGKSSLFSHVSASAKTAVAVGSWYNGPICGAGSVATPLVETVGGKSWHYNSTPKLRRGTTAGAAATAPAARFC